MSPVAQIASEPHGDWPVIWSGSDKHLASHPLGEEGLNLWPLHSRVETEPVARLGSDHVVLHTQRSSNSLGSVSVEPLTYRYVYHLESEHVLITTGGLVVSGQPVLSILNGGDPAMLARYDGQALTSGDLRFEVPVGEHQLVLRSQHASAAHVGAPSRVRIQSLPADALQHDVAESGWGSQYALVLSPGMPCTVNLEIENYGIDQAYLANTRKIAEGEWTRASNGENGVFHIPLPPEPKAGQSWTLLTRSGLYFRGAHPGRIPDPVTTPKSEPEIAKHSLRDITDISGIQFVHFEGPDLQLDIRPTMGPGAAWGDVNGDGWHDLYLVQGGGRAGVTSPNRLYKNLGEGKFKDMTETAGVGDTGAGMGALFFDANGDGHLDLYVANYGQDVLYQGNGDGTFTDVTVSAGIDSGLWSASASAADADGDGDLDLYVTRYLDFDLDKMPPLEALGGYERDDPPAMLPFAFPGQPNLFLRNESDANSIRFVDATEELGLANPKGLGMQSVWWDYDADGDQDLYVANDVSINVMFRNNGDGTFEDVTFGVGLDDPRGGMGLALGDVEGDGDEDLFLTNWELDTNALYVNRHKKAYGTSTRRSKFRDGTLHAGLAAPSIGSTSWGAVLFDMEADGDLDLFVANGYTSPDYATTGICVGQPNQLFLGDGTGQFQDGREVAGPALDIALASRGAVGCDWDRDGDVDLLVTSNNGRIQLLENRAPQEGHWISFLLDGTTANPFGVGAIVTIEHGSRTLRRTLRAGEGYLTSAPPELHFGLGPKDGPITARVTWPDGTETVHAGLEPGDRHRLSID